MKFIIADANLNMLSKTATLSGVRSDNEQSISLTVWGITKVDSDSLTNGIRDKKLFVTIAPEEKKKWRWHQFKENRWHLMLDGDRVPSGVVVFHGDVYTVDCMGWAQTCTSVKSEAMRRAEDNLRKSSYWREGDEIEPYKEPVPTLEEWLSVRNIRLANGLIWRNGDVHAGVNVVVMKYAHAAITEYFAKYPDAEPELRKQWEGAK